MAFIEKDPVMEALGMEPMPSYEEVLKVQHQQAQVAWCNAQAHWNAAMWQLQQLAMYQASATAPSAAPQDASSESPGTPPGEESSPAMAKSPVKASSEDASTSPGSSEAGGNASGESEKEEETQGDSGANDGDAEAQRALNEWLMREIQGAQESQMPRSPVAQVQPPQSPQSPAPKLELNALIFEKAKDPVSAHLLQLLKDGPQDGSLPAVDLPRAARASGAHRKAAAAIAAVALEAEEAAASQEEATSPARRRRRGGRGRGNRHK